MDRGGFRKTAAWLEFLRLEPALNNDNVDQLSKQWVTRLFDRHFSGKIFSGLSVAKVW
jgi:hypothetical protein